MSKAIAILLWFLLPAIAASQNSGAKPATLNECIDAALHYNPSISEAQNEVRIAELSYKTAEGGLYPTVSADASGGLSDTYRLGNNYRTGNASITANQVIWQKGNVRASINEAGNMHKSAELSLKSKRADITWAVKTAFLNCLLQDQLFSVSLNNVSKARLFLEYARERYKMGVARKSDVLKAESDLSQAEYESANYKNKASQSRNELVMLTGLSQDNLVSLEQPVWNEGLAISAYDSLLDLAIKNYPDLLALQNMELAQKERTQQANAAMYPQLSVKGGYDWSYNPVLKDQKGWYTVAALRWDIFSGNARRHRAQAEMVRELVYKNQTEQLKTFLVKEISNTLIAIKEAEEKIALSLRLMASTSENLEIAKGQYQAGTGSMLELTDARIDDLSAKQKNIQAIAAYQLAIANLERLTNSTYDI
ncbi:MAG TPA: TolC family protein [Bacteroidales bacterium]|nr:TolC family protein [Bacteroidales bacterium]